MTIEELKIEEDRLWAEYLGLEKPLNAKRDEWLSIRNKREQMILRERLREELRSESEKKPEQQAELG